MGMVGDTIESFKSLQIRQVATQAINLGMIVTSALIMWKGLMCFTGSESPIVVVLSESMEPAFKRGAPIWSMTKAAMLLAIGHTELLPKVVLARHIKDSNIKKKICMSLGNPVC